MSQGFQSEMREAFDEPLRELRGTAQMMQDAVNNPVRSVTDDLTGTSAPAAPSVEPTPAVPVDAVAPAEEVQAPVEEEPSAPEGPAGAATEPAAVPEADAGGTRAGARRPARRRRAGRRMSHRPRTAPTPRRSQQGSRLADAPPPQGEGREDPPGRQERQHDLDAAPGGAADAPHPLPAGGGAVRRDRLRPVRPLDPGLPVPPLPRGVRCQRGLRLQRRAAPHHAARRVRHPHEGRGVGWLHPGHAGGALAGLAVHRPGPGGQGAQVRPAVHPLHHRAVPARGRAGLPHAVEGAAVAHLLRRPGHRGVHPRELRQPRRA